MNALLALEGRGVAHVLIHDGARPLVSAAVIDRVRGALEASPAAAPALAVTDALWTGTQGLVSGTRDRTGLYRAHTPQGFHYDAILAAHRAHPGGAAEIERRHSDGRGLLAGGGASRGNLVTGDADFAYLALQLRRSGIRVEVASVAANLGSALKSSANEVIDLASLLETFEPMTVREK